MMLASLDKSGPIFLSIILQHLFYKKIGTVLPNDAGIIFSNQTITAYLLSVDS